MHFVQKKKCENFQFIIYNYLKKDQHKTRSIPNSLNKN